jgi:excisionase family DNA binding protein
MSPAFTYPKEATTMFSNYPDVLNIKQVCEMLGIGRNNAYALIKNNVITSVRIGRKIRVTKESVIEFINNAKQV